jgi:NTE family protein
MVAHPLFSAEKPLLTDLALQGGGSHGAFSWGVIDRLLEEEWVKLDGISGTSAGAMNAAVLAYGLLDGGRAGAKKALEDFWKRVSDGARFSPFHPQHGQSADRHS